MSTRSTKLNRYFLVTIVGASTWLAACSISYDMSSLSGGRQHENAANILKDVVQVTPLSPTCEALAEDLVEAGLKARAAHWMPTNERLKVKEDEAAKHYELGACPIKALPVLAFAVSSKGNDQERQRVKARDERW